MRTSFLLAIILGLLIGKMSFAEQNVQRTVRGGILPVSQQLTEKEQELKGRLDAAGIEYRALGESKQYGGLGLWLSVDKIVDFSPLKGMNIVTLDCQNAKKVDLFQIRGLPLKVLVLRHADINDISALNGMELEGLDISNTQVHDLSPLKGMPLTWLDVEGTNVTNLSALKGMKLTSLNIHNTSITDIAPLEGMPLDHITLTKGINSNQMNILRNMKSLRHINGWYEDVAKGLTAKEFWERYDADKQK